MTLLLIIVNMVRDPPQPSSSTLNPGKLVASVTSSWDRIEEVHRDAVHLEAFPEQGEFRPLVVTLPQPEDATRTDREAYLLGQANGAETVLHRMGCADPVIVARRCF